MFHRGKRPTPAAVRAIADEDGGFAVTFEPSGDSAEVEAGQNWLELLINGLTFDLVGLAGGPAALAPHRRHLFGIEEVPPDLVEAVTLAAGPHLAGGEAMMPIARSQLALALRLGQLPGLVAIAWAPAQSWMAVDYFTAAVSSWLQGGPFPALGLTALLSSPDGGVQSEGLAYFTGQELRIEPELADDRQEARQLAVRLLNTLANHGRLHEPLELDAPDGGSLLLEPSANQAFVRVRLRR